MNKVMTIEQSIDFDKMYRDVLSKLSHTVPEAFAELVDNSLDANAQSVVVVCDEDKFTICDDGLGMNVKELINSCAFSSKTSELSLIGKFGCGGTAASAVIAAKKKILTKKNGQPLLVAKQNLIKDVTNISFTNPTDQELKLFDEKCGNSGTIIILSKLKPVHQTRIGDRKSALIKHFSEVFRKYLEGGKKIKIVDGKGETSVKPFDPLFWNDGSKILAEFNLTKSFTYNGKTVNIRAVQLNPAAFAKNETGAPSLANQGFHMIRDERQIAHLNHISGLWQRHNDLNSLRVEVQFPVSLDEEFGVQMSKNKTILKQPIVDKMKSIVVPWLNERRKHIQKNRLKTENKQLDNLDKKFVEDFASKAASIGVPRKISDNGDKKKREAGSKRGTVKKKGTQITRQTKQEIYEVPIIERVTDVNNPRSHWFDEGVVTINEGSKFIQDLYVNADDKTRFIMRSMFFAEYFASRVYLDGTEEKNTIEAYREDFLTKLLNTHKQLMSC
jgi:hypothetical protein